MICRVCSPVRRGALELAWARNRSFVGTYKRGYFNLRLMRIIANSFLGVMCLSPGWRKGDKVVLPKRCLRKWPGDPGRGCKPVSARKACTGWPSAADGRSVLIWLWFLCNRAEGARARRQECMVVVVFIIVAAVTFVDFLVSAESRRTPRGGKRTVVPYTARER